MALDLKPSELRLMLRMLAKEEARLLRPMTARQSAEPGALSVRAMELTEVKTLTDKMIEEIERRNRE